MKRNILIIISAGLSAILLSSPAWGQQTDDVAVQTAEDIRPDMPRLFYTSEQRRVLEAVRQDVISEEDFEEDGFIPLILQQERIDLATAAQTERNDSISFDSFIRNRGTGNGVWWSGRVERGFSGKDDELGREGLAQFVPSPSGDGTIVGVDKFNSTRFILKVGQQLSPDGEVSETYPVIIKKN